MLKPQSKPQSLSKSGLEPDIDLDEGMQSIRNGSPRFKAKQEHPNGLSLPSSSTFVIQHSKFIIRATEMESGRKGKCRMSNAEF